jgi:hypothetical protein
MEASSRLSGGGGRDYVEVFVTPARGSMFLVINGSPVLGAGEMQLGQDTDGWYAQIRDEFDRVEVEYGRPGPVRTTLHLDIIQPEVVIRSVTDDELSEIRQGYGASPATTPEPPEDGELSDRDLRQAIMQVLTGRPDLLERFQAELELNEGIAADFTELCENIDRLVQALFGARLTPAMLRNAWGEVRASSPRESVLSRLNPGGATRGSMHQSSHIHDSLVRHVNESLRADLERALFSDDPRGHAADLVEADDPEAPENTEQEEG